MEMTHKSLKPLTGQNRAKPRWMKTTVSTQLVLCLLSQLQYPKYFTSITSLFLQRTSKRNKMLYTSQLNKRAIKTKTSQLMLLQV